MLRNTVTALLKEGRHIFRYPLKATVAAGDGVVVVSVPKRHFNRAVKRNLLKRRIREAYRLNREILGDAGYNIFFYYVGTEIESYDKISESIRSILSDMAAGKADTAV